MTSRHELGDHDEQRPDGMRSPRAWAELLLRLVEDPSAATVARGHQGYGELRVVVAALRLWRAARPTDSRERDASTLAFLMAAGAGHDASRVVPTLRWLAAVIRTLTERPPVEGSQATPELLDSLSSDAARLGGRAVLAYGQGAVSPAVAEAMLLVARKSAEAHALAATAQDTIDAVAGEWDA
jgi:hypothetical protein